MRSIPKESFFRTNLRCLFRSYSSKYEKMMGKAESAVTKELDIVKFIRR